jgi:predicted DNA-binding protein with PD1-like motif
VGRLDPGEELVEVITDLCEEHDIEGGELRLLGTLSSVELVHFDADERTYVPHHAGEGDYRIAQLHGNVATMGGARALRLDAMLAVDAPVGPQFVTGQLRSATVDSVEFVLDVFEDLRIERSLDVDSGRLLVSEIHATEAPEAPAPAPAPEAVVEESAEEVEEVEAAEEEEAAEAPKEREAPKESAKKSASPKESPKKSEAPKKSGASAMSWGEALEKAEESEGDKRARKLRKKKKKREAEEEELLGEFEELLKEESVELEAGDLIDHPKLGRCRVMKVDGEEHAHIRLASGRISKLALQICEFTPKGEEDGRQVYQCRVRR